MNHSALTPEHLARIKAGTEPSRDDVNRQVTAEGRLTQGGGKRKYRPRVLHADPRTISKDWPYAVMRIKRILEGAARSSSIEGAVSGAEYPALAKQYMETWIYYMTRDRSVPVGKVDHNPFRHLSDGDAMRKFVRFVEDVCDRSTGKLHAWRTK